MTNALAQTRTLDVVLEAQNVSVRLSPKGEQPITALSDLSVSARRGQVTGFVGPDGSGKTTLLRLTIGLLTPTSGQMSVLGLDPSTDLDLIRSRIGYMPQHFGLYEDLTIQENLDLFADLHCVAHADRAPRFDRLMQMTGLAPFTNRLAGQLSGGMKQKLGLACCLVKPTDLLVLDEPTVGVDPVSRRDLWAIVYELVEKDGLGVVLSTSYLDEAERCHHVVLMHEGKRLDEGPPAHFRARVLGRVYLVTPAKGQEPRDVQARLSLRADVIDATIRSGRIRTVFTRETDQGQLDLPREYADHFSAVEPVFEDAFMDILATEKAGQARHPSPMQVATDHSAEKAHDVVVRVAGLSKKFGEFTAVEGIRFDVRRGEIFGLLGPNGAGKTTTFRMLCGLLPATGGEISVAGHDLRRSPAEARSRIGYMAQKFSLYTQLPVVHNLRFYGQAYGLSGSKLRARVEWAFDEFDLGDWQHVLAGSLPGGYRQRLAMAVAMLHEPDILFLDEPSSGADPLARREFWLRINGFARSGVTVIVTTHFMEEAEFCDHLLIMSRGTTLAQGTPAAIRMLARTAHRPDPTVEDAFIELAEGSISPETETGADV